MQYKSYKVTCKDCGDSDILKITPDNTVFYTNHTPIISSRFRPDMNWGFECMCGNDSRLAIEEKNQLKMLVKGAENSIKEISARLKKNNEKRFSMEQV